MHEPVCARKTKGVTRCVGVVKVRSPTTDINSTASSCTKVTQLMGSKHCPCAQQRPRVRGAYVWGRMQSVRFVFGWNE